MAVDEKQLTEDILRLAATETAQFPGMQCADQAAL